MTDRSNLLALVGRMKVERLARLVGLRVDELVATVMDARPGPGPSGTTPAIKPAPAKVHRAPTDAGPPAPTATAEPVAEVVATPSSEPPLAAMFGQLTHRELHRVVDRWLLGRVLAEEDGNVSHAAQRLGISRRTLREHRDRAQDPSVDRWATRAQSMASVADVPEPPSLSPLLTSGGSYRDLRTAIDRWLIGGILAREQNNVTRAARCLGMSRKDLRARWARVRA